MHDAATDRDDGYTQTVPLSDRERCGEDLIANAQQTIRFAPVLCRDCRSYHLRHTLWRVVSPRTSSTRSDRSEMIDLVAGIVGGVAAASPDPIRIVVAGAADTGILATCAHAVASLGPAIARRVAYTVIDLCMTPLSLCESFARQHRLPVELHSADLCNMAITIPADLVVLHSVLSYLPRSEQQQTLRTLKSWLKPEGSMLVSNRVRLAERRRPSDADIVATYVEACAARGVRCRSPELVVSYLDQPPIPESEFDHWDEVATLLAASGLTIEREFRITREPKPGEKLEQTSMTGRYVALASAD
jgi:hypothetical protein